MTDRNPPSPKEQVRALPGGQIGLMAGSKANQDWSGLVRWLRDRSRY